MEEIKMTNEEILNAISEMSVLELSELVKAIEDKFGVSAAAPVAVAAAAPAAAAAEEEAAAAAAADTLATDSVAAETAE